MRWQYDAVDLPGINLNVSCNPEAVGAPTRGRRLDHIGFEVTELARFCRRLEPMGVTFDELYRRIRDRWYGARLTDPRGVSIVLTEGLRD